MKFTIILIITLFSIKTQLFSQALTKNTPAPDFFPTITKAGHNQVKITIIQDTQIKNLVNKYIETQRKDNKVQGFRIRIFSNSGQAARQTAINERGRFIELFPDIPAQYVSYEAPNFKVYVGDFRTKQEAYRAFKLISKEFKNAFLVQTRINLPKL